MSAKKPSIEVTSTTPDYALKKKLGPDVSLRDAFSDDVIASAESVIEESKNDFFGDALKDVHTMEDAYAYAIKTPKESKPHIKEIERKVFSLKGQSETLGFDLLAHASKSLYDFCTTYFRAGDSDQLIVVRKHLDTIKLIIKEKMQGDGGPVGNELIKSLHLLTKKYK
jgi:chemotaxis protein histidine kinase CheA